MSKIWGRNGRETAVAEWRWGQLKTERAGKPHAFRVDLAQGAGKFKLHCVAGRQRFGRRVWGPESPAEENKQLVMRLQQGAEERRESAMALSARGSGSG